jgi:hypothetical protein
MAEHAGLGRQNSDAMLARTFPNADERALGYSSRVRMIASEDVAYRRARRERARRQIARRRRRVAGFTLLATAVAAALWISGVRGGSPAPRLSSANDARRPVAARASVRNRTVRALPARSSPGSLPQTHAYPSGTSAQFKSLMASLWAGIARGSLAPALTAFFPQDAFVRLKAIASASSDWTDRLVHDYRLDITAAHALLGPNAAHARLVAVNVPASYGHWVQPGVCDNVIGYYEMPNARVVYREDGRIRSFGIASMISWRGVWYVVHLGAILRSTDSGTVDEPGPGPGTSAYSGTC